MIPACAKLGSLELVLAGHTRCNGALGDTGDSIVLTGVQLSDSVPVVAGSVMGKAVLDVDDDSVTPLCTHEGSRILVVNQHHLLFCATAIRIWPGNIGDIKVISDSSTIRGSFGIKVGSNAVAIAPAASCAWSVGASTILSLDNFLK